MSNQHIWKKRAMAGAVLAGAAAITPQALSAAPGLLGYMDVTYVSNAGGLGILGPGEDWRFGNASYGGAEVAARAFNLLVTKVYGPDGISVLADYTGDPGGGKAIFSYCGERSLGMPSPGTTVRYEWVQLRSLGYYSFGSQADGIGPSGIGLAKAKMVQDLADTSWQDSAAGNNNIAGYQLAQWKVVNENVPGDNISARAWSLDINPNLATPNDYYVGITNDQLTGAYVTAANTYLAGALAEYIGNTTPSTPLTALISDGPGDFLNQDLIMRSWGFDSPIPEPSTYALVAGLGLVGFGLYRRFGSKA